MRALALLAVGVLAGCAAVEPIARFPAGDHAQCGVGAVGSNGFAVQFGDDIIIVTSAGTRRLAGACAGVPNTWCCVAISSDGGVVARSDLGRGVFVRDVSSGGVRTLVTDPRPRKDAWNRQGSPKPFALSADGSLVAFSSAGETRVVALREWRVVTTFPFEARWLGFSPDGARIACDDCGSSVEHDDFLVFDVATGARLLRVATPVSIETYTGGFSTDGRELVVDVGPQLLRLPRTGEKRLEDLEDQPATGKRLPFPMGNFWALASDGRFFAGRADGTVHVFDTVFGREVACFLALEKEVCLVLLSRDEQQLLVGAGDTLALLDATTGELLRVIVPPSSAVERVELRGDELLVTHEGAAVSVLDRKTGALHRVLPRTLDGEAAARETLSPDGRLEVRSLSTTDYGVFRAGSLERLWRDAVARACAFSADSLRLAVAGEELTVRDARTGDTLATLGGVDPSHVTALAFSPDGRELACGCDDGSVLLYDVSLPAATFSETKAH